MTPRRPSDATAMVKEAIQKALFNMRTWAEKMPPASPDESAETRYHVLRQWGVGTRTPLPENCDRLVEGLEVHRREVDEAIELLRSAATRTAAVEKHGE